MLDTKDCHICENCGMVSTGEKPDVSVYDYAYAHRYEEYEGLPTTKLLMQIRSKWLTDFVPKGSAVLDYGCAVGAFLRSVSQDYICTGYDINPEAIKIAKKLNGKCRFTDNEDEALQPKTYNAITMFDVLEHTENPKAVLEKIVRSLKPQGFLFVSVPNLDAWDKGKPLKEWRHHRLKEHFHHFNAMTLGKLFHTVSVLPYTSDYRESRARDTYENNILCMVGVKA